MNKLALKPSHKSIKDYYTALDQFHKLGISHEGAVKGAFQSLLDVCGRQFQWKLTPEWQIRRPGGSIIWVDGALVDTFKLTHGFWEAKDTQDKLEREVKKKFEQGYPKNNIIFQEPERAIVYQDGNQILDEDITRDAILVEVLKLFFAYQPPEFIEWEEAVAAFKDRIPELADRLVELIEDERRTNKSFINAFSGFMQLCKQSINPNLSEKAVEEMLIQHLLTERIFSKVFDNPDFANKNVIAAEIEKVVNALTSRSFSRHEFMKDLSHFYGALEKAASTISDFTHKQHFLNTVYENFFQGFSVKVADTHGIVYTPQPIVNFMVKSVEDILKKEFGKSLSDKGVHILDPFVGTGNFIVRIVQEINKTDLPYKYEYELHCNEVMLLPYYIASMNIEHEYYERTGKYKPFEGICLVDTFELAEEKQQSLFTQQNTERVIKQKETPIFVIIGNPPYNARQLNENDNNKNRKYNIVDKRVSETYSNSAASSVNRLNDPYVKAFRWASDRISKEGIIAYVSNNSFIDNTAFDGMRKHLREEFDSIYVLDLGGNVRKNPKLSGTIHNVFGIQVGVSINLFVKKSNKNKSPQIYYSRVDEFWRKEEKYKYIEKVINISNIKWKIINKNRDNIWLTEGMRVEFTNFISMGNKDTKSKKESNVNSIFKNFGLGLNTNRDAWCYNFDCKSLTNNIKLTINFYNEHIIYWKNFNNSDTNIDDFVKYQDDKISWSEGLKNYLRRGIEAKYCQSKIRNSSYRPFIKSFLYFDPCFVERRYQYPYFLPTIESESENQIICLSSIGSVYFSSFISNIIINLNYFAGSSPVQCFPYYTYSEDGTNRRENITDWALEQFRSHYNNNKISKWDVFYFVYGILHHPQYRERYAANLRRELPRIPFAPDFFSFAQAGEKLADLHINYEKQEEYVLEKIENLNKPLNWRVEKMRLSKDKSSIVYNDFLTLSGIPAEAFDYRLGNRSALEWIIDQYQIKTDKRSGIVNNPNREDDEQYIVRLIGQVITVSLKTVEMVKGLPELSVHA